MVSWNLNNYKLPNIIQGIRHEWAALTIDKSTILPILDYAEFIYDQQIQ